MAEAQYEEGKRRRKACPRSSHAAAPHLLDDRDVLGLLEASNQDRLAHLVPIRHARMLESPFTFFRGSAILQAHDLAHTPSSGIQVQTCGDCHLLNFGGFATPERHLVFDLNDFDETFPGPWEWDIKRLTTSLVLAARWRGFSDATAREAASAAVAGYREKTQRYANMPTMAVWYSQVTWDDVRASAHNDAKFRKLIDAHINRAQRRTSEHVFAKLVTDRGTDPRIQDQPPLLFHPRTENVLPSAQTFLQAYATSLRGEHRALLSRFRLVDVVMKVVGVGSVGTRCLVMLMLGEHDNPLFLQAKEARRSVLQTYVGPSPWQHDGERVVAGQRLLQAVSDIFLGWSRGPEGRDFYVRQLRDMKIAADIDQFDAGMLVTYGALCGATLARAHAKAGQASYIAGYLGRGDAFDRAIELHAMAYADQAERDYATFRAAARAGRIRTEPFGPALDPAIA